MEFSALTQDIRRRIIKTALGHEVLSVKSQGRSVKTVEDPSCLYTGSADQMLISRQFHQDVMSTPILRMEVVQRGPVEYLHTVLFGLRRPVSVLWWTFAHLLKDHSIRFLLTWLESFEWAQQISKLRLIHNKGRPLEGDMEKLRFLLPNCKIILQFALTSYTMKPDETYEFV